MPSLLFLISQPRSGSTLLQNLLARHPEIHTTPEPWLLLHPVYALREEGHTAEYNAVLAHTALLDFLDTLEDGRARVDEAIRAYAQHLYGNACARTGKSIFLDKTPRYYHILPDILRIFPEAHVILLYRNPMAVLYSFLESRVKGHWILLARYRHDFLTAPAAMLDAARQHPERVHTLRYEDLVTDPEGTLRTLCDAVALEFTPDMLTYDPRRAAAGHMGDETGVQRHNRPSTASLERWKKLGETAQTQHFALAYLDALGAETLQAMGYDYAALRTALESGPARGKITLTWEQLFRPDEAMQKRLALVELALLEHRRLVHAWRRWRRHIFGGAKS